MMECDYAGLVDLIAEISNMHKLFIPIWIMLGVIVGVGVKQFVDDMRGKYK